MSKDVITIQLGAVPQHRNKSSSKQRQASKESVRSSHGQGQQTRSRQSSQGPKEAQKNDDFLLRGPTMFRQELDVALLIDVCSKKLQEDPQHKKALFIRSSSLLKKGFLKEAIADCDELLRLSPRNVGALYVRGCVLEKMGNIDDSIKDFTRVLEMDPDHVNAAYARGACENRRGNFEKAIEDYQMALDKDRDRSQSPDRNQRRRLNKREILLSRELSANKQKVSSALIKMQSMTGNGKNNSERPLPRAPNSKTSNDRVARNDGSVSSQNRQSVANRQKLLLSPGMTNMRISLDEDTVK